VEGFLTTEDGFSRFYRANVNGLLVFFTRRAFDVQIALDLTAETFAQAFASRRKFRGETDATAAAWLFTIAHRQLARYFEDGIVRRKLSSRLAGGVPVVSEAEAERIEELASLDELRTVLREQLQALEPGQRQALWLRVVDEQPYAAVAVRLGISEQAARARVSRALRVLSEPLAAAVEISAERSEL
jgi:RNA polymerase sigma factor (sigma-70 family)